MVEEQCESNGERQREGVREIEREKWVKEITSAAIGYFLTKELALVSRSPWEFLSSPLCLQPASFQLQASPQLDRLKKRNNSPLFFLSFFF